MSRSYEPSEENRMPDVAGMAIDPRTGREGNRPFAGEIYVVLENGEVYGSGLEGVEWEQMPPVPNTPAAEGDDED